MNRVQGPDLRQNAVCRRRVEGQPWPVKLRPDVVISAARERRRASFDVVGDARAAVVLQGRCFARVEVRPRTSAVGLTVVVRRLHAATPKEIKDFLRS
eukprot:scaffold71007_cov71-Phaeocystis_antarctica.AAC.3